MSGCSTRTSGCSVGRGVAHPVTFLLLISSLYLASIAGVTVPRCTPAAASPLLITSHRPHLPFSAVPSLLISNHQPDDGYKGLPRKKGLGMTEAEPPLLHSSSRRPPPPPSTPVAASTFRAATPHHRRPLPSNSLSLPSLVPQDAGSSGKELGVTRSGS